MKVGIMGGTFDPIHTGHLLVGETAREAAQLDEVWFMPANVPPHKKNAPLATTRQRWEMVCLAVQDHPSFMACDVEIAKGGTSFTIETVELLQAAYPDNSFYYIIGGDMVQYLQHWHRIGELVQRLTFIGVQRPGIELNLDQLSHSVRSAVTMVNMPLIEISSTNIRERRSAGKSVRYLVPESVREYMERAKLYE